MKIGHCPKCGSSTVHTKRKGISLGDGGVHVHTEGVSKPTPLDHFVCTTCGYFEGYIVDPVRLEAVAGKWDKVAPG